MMLMDPHRYRRCEAYFAIYRRSSAPETGRGLPATRRRHRMPGDIRRIPWETRP